MKQAIMGYITALINVHNDALTRIPENNVANSNIKTFTNELNDLLDYVADIPEDKQPMTVVLNNNVDITSLKEYVKELEESCEANNEVIRQQWDKIVRLKDENRELKSRFRMEEI